MSAQAGIILNYLETIWHCVESVSKVGKKLCYRRSTFHQKIQFFFLSICNLLRFHFCIKSINETSILFVTVLLIHPVVPKNCSISTTSCNNGSKKDSNFAHHGRTKSSGTIIFYLKKTRKFFHQNLFF